MSGTLYLVATPIGNLEDITLRALRILREVDLIAAEDTRHSARLLNHYGITTRTTSLHKHNEHQRTPGLVDRLVHGNSVALLSDAGTPLVSDPGSQFVRHALEAGVAVVPLPGPSAVISALIASGAPLDRFTFVGFPPKRSNDRIKWCQSLASIPTTIVFFESPHRLTTTLKMIRDHWGDREAALCRELTKIHEELVVRPISGLIEAVGKPRGEYTCVVWPPPVATHSAPELPTGIVLAHELAQTIGKVGSRRDGVKEMARKYKLSQRKMYAAIETSKKIAQKT